MTNTSTIGAGTSHINKPCPFCTLPAGRVVEENEHVLLIMDGFPVSPGHSLIIPKRHVGSFFDAIPPERAALLALLDRAKELVEKHHAQAGYNIGINAPAQR